jgi:hypothetical protein
MADAQLGRRIGLSASGTRHSFACLNALVLGKRLLTWWYCLTVLAWRPRVSEQMASIGWGLLSLERISSELRPNPHESGARGLEAPRRLARA